MARANRLNDKKVQAATKPGCTPTATICTAGRQDALERGHAPNRGCSASTSTAGAATWVSALPDGKPRQGPCPAQRGPHAGARRHRSDRGPRRRADKEIRRLSVKEATEAYIDAQAPNWKTARYPDQIRERMRLRQTDHRRYGDRRHRAGRGPSRARADLEPKSDREANPPAPRRRRRQCDRRRSPQERGQSVRDQATERVAVVPQAAHFASLPFEQAPAFFTELRAQDGIKARALEFVMCAVRVADVVGGGKEHSEPMKWSHVDLAERIWTVPDTKMGRPHFVPLRTPHSPAGPDAALSRPGHRLRVPGRQARHGDQRLNVALFAADLGYGEIATVHGFRASFKTWAEEVMNFEGRGRGGAGARQEGHGRAVSPRIVLGKAPQIDGPGPPSWKVRLWARWCRCGRAGAARRAPGTRGGDAGTRRRRSALEPEPATIIIAWIALQGGEIGCAQLLPIEPDGAAQRLRPSVHGSIAR